MAIVHFENESRVNDFRCGFTADWDDVTRDMVVNVWLLDDRNGGQPVPSSQYGQAQSEVFVRQNNNQEREVDFFALGLVNAGPTTFPNINLKTFAQRGNGTGVEYRTFFVPPAR